MPCVNPLTGWKARSVNKSGKRSIVFKEAEGLPFSKLQIDCGQCIGCRLEKSRQWALRAEKESQMYERNCFLTLTYSDEFLPPGGSLVRKHFQDFFKRLRKKFGSGIRVFYCGEYGDKRHRPHFHACVFNFDFSDKKICGSSNGFPLYHSEDLNALWEYGLSFIGSLTFESAAYVARYVCKKLTGPLGAGAYGELVDDNGEVSNALTPEFCGVSRRPGLGRPWLDKFKSDVFPHDFVVSRGQRCRPPEYFTRSLEVSDPVLFAEIIRRRSEAARVKALDFRNQPSLSVEEKVMVARLSAFDRELPHGDS